MIHFRLSNLVYSKVALLVAILFIDFVVPYLFNDKARASQAKMKNCEWRLGACSLDLCS